MKNHNTPVALDMLNRQKFNRCNSNMIFQILSFDEKDHLPFIEIWIENKVGFQRKDKTLK